MMKTLFLHPPSFDGFDGGAGSRYQARREIRSFWYPTWLAQPAALVPDSRLVDAPPARLRLGDILPLAARLRIGRAAHLDPVFRLGREGRRGPQGRQPAAQDRHGRRQGSGRARGQPEGVARPRFRRPRGIRFHDQGGGRGPCFRCDRRSQLARRRRQGQPQPRPRGARRHGPAALCQRGLQARPQGRRLLYRLSAAPLFVALHRARLPLEVHVLPVAADGRRPSLPGAQRRLTSSKRSASPKAGFRK